MFKANHFIITFDAMIQIIMEIRGVSSTLLHKLLSRLIGAQIAGALPLRVFLTLGLTIFAKQLLAIITLVHVYLSSV